MKKRLFIGIPLPDIWKKELSKYKHLTLDKSTRFVPENNFHITLNFLGYVEEEKTEDIESLLLEAAKKTLPFALELDSVMIAPPGETPRMIWALFKESNEFLYMVRTLKSSLSFLNHKDLYEPMPHVTIARFDPSVKMKGMDIFQPTLRELEVNGFNLYESRLSRKGSDYTILKSFSINPLNS